VPILDTCHAGVSAPRRGRQGTDGSNAAKMDVDTPLVLCPVPPFGALVSVSAPARALMRRMFGVHALNYSQYPVMTPLRTWSTVKVAGFCTPSAGSDQDLTNKMHFGDSVVCKQSNAAFSCALGQGKSPSY